jgi:predicted nucleic acid-binding protein
MPVVLDASAGIAWLSPDEHSGCHEILETFVVECSIYAPFLWWYEMHNSLLVKQRRSLISQSDIDGIMKRLQKIPIQFDFSIPNETKDYARKHALSFYDASYIELALRLDCPLATLDQKLAAAMKSAGGSVLVCP